MDPFAVEEKSSRRYIGRVGPWCPPGWPGFEVGWGIDSAYSGKGYAGEAARASIDWVFASFEIDEIIHCIEGSNEPSKGVARRLGAPPEADGVFDLVRDMVAATASKGKLAGGN
ncbi:GNAT family N-acetyltransferase [Bradyrhizobium sp. 190]|uniref:GNAT family N-acetyltransferase n=1 Tax=Bradyrhizobium sp. 190 TaxID=2782658 RepID=UPI001FF71682|nr:GNAT family N-acetyltransferase [Bradyrhizobium sp. 190]